MKQSILTLLGLLGLLACLTAQELRPPEISPDGNVFSMKRHKNILYVGGSFDKVGYQTGGAAMLPTGQLPPNMEFPVLNGEVYAIIPDGNGGWFVGGDFDRADLEDAFNFAHILPNMVPDSTFLPEFNGRVLALALINDTLFVGGQFQEIDGVIKPYLAAFQVSTETLLPWSPEPDGKVNVLQASGSSILVGGDFDKIAGRAQPSLARLNRQTGDHGYIPAPEIGGVNDMKLINDTIFVAGNMSGSMGYYSGNIASFQQGETLPALDFPIPNGNVEAIIPDGNGGWYIGGSFSQINEVNHRRLAHILPDNSIDPLLNLTFTGNVYDLVLDGNTLYLCGTFTSIDGQPRSRLAAIDVTTGTLTNWDPGASATVRTMMLDGNDLYVGGTFTEIAGDQQYRLAKLDKTTGQSTPIPCPSNGEVKSIQKVAGNIVVGGTFTGASGDFTGRLAQFNNGAELPELDFLNFEGTVEIIVPDGTGGWYVGGAFTKISGQTQSRLAHILPNGTIDPAFSFTFNNSVLDILLFNDTMMVAGNFTTIDGQPHGRLAGIDMSTNTVLPWAPNLNSRVNGMAIFNDTMMIAGQFTTADGQTRNRLAAYDLTTGNLTAWNPDASSTVQGIIRNGNEMLVYGNFSSIGGQTRNRLAAIDPITGLLTAWDPNANSSVLSMWVDGTTAYIGGNFTQVGGQSRARLAEVDLITGLPTAWDPGANLTVDVIYGFNDTMMVGGNFTQIGGQNINRLAKIDKQSGNLISWFPNPNNWVYAIAHDGNTLMTGGSFVNVRSETRNRLFSLDQNNFQLSAFNPNPNSTVQDILVKGDSIIIGGNFTTVGGQAHQRLAKIDMVSETVDAGWNPGASGTVNKLLAWNDTMMIAGNFADVNGTPSPYLTALDIGSGALLNWNPAPNKQVLSLGFQNGQLVSGGQFKVFQGQARRRAYAVDMQTSGLTIWDPDVGGFGIPRVNALAFNDTMMFIGGAFSSLGGQSRVNVGAVNLTDGAALPFQADTDDQVYSLEIFNDTMMLMGGNFDQIGGVDRRYGGAVNIETGVVNAWNPIVDYRIHDFAQQGGELVMGGEFEMADTRYRDNVYALDIFNDTILAWSPNPPDLVRDIEVANDGGTVYLLANNFSNQKSLLAVDNQLGNSIPGWDVTVIGTAVDLERDPRTGTLFLGGYFNTVNGQPRSKFAALDANGNLLPWSMDFDDDVLTMSFNDTMMYIGGSFENVNGVPRYKLAAVDINGNLSDWSPQTDVAFFSGISNIKATRNRVYFSGSFSEVEGKKRKQIAAVSPKTGQPLPWNPRLDQGFSTLAVNFIETMGDAVLIGGDVRNIAGTSVQGLAHVSALSGRIAKRIPLLGYHQAFVAASDDSTLYIGGGFNALNKKVYKHFSSMKFETSFFASQIEKYRPKKGGNAGDVTMEIIGNGFVPGTKVILRKTGFADIVGLDSGQVVTGEVAMRVPFVLRGEPAGFRDLVIEIPGDTTIVLPDAFEVVARGEADTWADVLTPNFVSRGHRQAYYLTYGNAGNVDAVGVPIWLAVSPNVEIKRMQYRQIQVLDTTQDFLDSIPQFVRVDTLLGKPYDANIYSLILPKIPAGATGTIRFTAIAPQPGRFKMRAWASDPLYGSPLKYYFGDCFDTWFGAAIGFVPFAGCAYGAFDVVASPIVDAALDDDFGSASWAGSYAQTVAGTAAGCVLDFTTAGVGRVVAEVIDQTIKAKTTADVLEKCLTPEEKDDSEGDVVTSADPNDKSGRQGEGGLGWLRSDQVFPYLIRFENMDTATAPAKLVIIRDTLDQTKYDLSSLQVLGCSIADSLYTFPKGQSSYQMLIDLRPRLPMYADVSTSLDTLTGEMVWTFTSLDTLDLSPITHPLVGFLPPNTDSISGTGSVLYTIELRDDVQTGDQFQNTASIYFDFNEAIVTNTVLNTIDDDLPESAVLALPDSVAPSFTLEWSGNDVGSGIRYYDVYFRENNGLWLLAAEQYSDSSLQFSGTPGSFYEFYSLAYDTALNREVRPLMADASTFISSTVGVEEELQTETVTLFPNPNPGSFQLAVTAEKTNDMEVLIFDTMGKKVYADRFLVHSGEQYFPIQLNVPAGVYHVQYRIEDRVQTQKMVVE